MRGKVEMDQGNEKLKQKKEHKSSFCLTVFHRSKACVIVTSTVTCSLNMYTFVFYECICACVRKCSCALWSCIFMGALTHTHILCGQGKTLRAQLPLQYSPDSSPFFIGFLLLSFSLPGFLRIPWFSLGHSLAAAGYSKGLFLLPSLSLNQPLTPLTLSLPSTCTT